MRLSVDVFVGNSAVFAFPECSLHYLFIFTNRFRSYLSSLFLLHIMEVNDKVHSKHISFDVVNKSAQMLNHQKQPTYADE